MQKAGSVKVLGVMGGMGPGKLWTRGAELESEGQMKKALGYWMLVALITGGLLVPGVREIRAEVKPTLTILPFIAEKADDPSKAGTCPICKGVFRRGEVPSGSPMTLTRLFYRKMETLGTFRVIPIERAENAFSRVDQRDFEDKPIPASIQFGKELNADFVFMGFIFRFEERKGSSLGVEKPASAGFDLHLLRIKDGRVVWDGRFDETQRPLSDNLLQAGSFFRRGAHWLTVEELAGDGMEVILKRLPGVTDLMEGP
jgi:hypothetical protein